MVYLFMVVADFVLVAEDLEVVADLVAVMEVSVAGMIPYNWLAAN